MNRNVLTGNKRFEPLLEHIERTRQTINASAAAVVVIQDGRIAAESYSGCHHAKAGALPVTERSQFNVYSVRKTHIGLALAMAVLEGGLDLDAPVRPFVAHIQDEQLEGVTLRHVLTKTKRKFFGPERVEGEGLAAAVVKHVTGRTIAQLIGERVLQPLQLNETEWAAVPKESLVCDYTAGDGYASVRLESDEGHERNLYMSARDLAYWGCLHMNGGMMNGRQIVPRAVFDLANRLREAPDYRHKRIMGWYYHDGFFDAMGATGCHVVCVSEHNTVAVRMYNRYATEHTPTLLNCLQR